MTKLLVKECTKLIAFVFSIVTSIYFFERRYERLGNQFSLDENTQIYHQKNYSNLFKDQDINVCSLYPDTLKGVVEVDVDNIPPLKDVEKLVENLKKGGLHIPSNCIPREKLAIIIPYRDRETNLILLLKYLHPLLQKQQRYYRIILVEQFGNDIFNKGRIMNIAAKEALKIDDFDCFIFHDVDLIPENDMNIYECYSEPRHLSPAVDELRYNLMYYNLVGGVLALNLEQLNRTNGYSNLYWGWGAEDDDMSMRILDSGYRITRPPSMIGRYKMILHGKRMRAINRFELLDYWKRYHTDGLNALENMNYTIKSIMKDYLYTNITVDIGPSVKEEIDKAKIPNSNFRFY